MIEREHPMGIAVSALRLHGPERRMPAGGASRKRNHVT